MAAIKNGLLAALPREAYRKLLPDLVPVTLAFGQVLYEPDAPMHDVYFPTSCLVSLLTIVEGHLALEVGLVGREGVTEAAGRLQAEGLIEYTRGRITVLDRDQLEAHVCECYSVVKKEYDRLLPALAAI